MHASVAAELADRGVIAAADHPRLRSTLGRLYQAGALANPLPGIYLPAGDHSRLGWLRAVSAWSAPLGVLHGRTAAEFWLPGGVVATTYLAHPSLRPRRGVTVSRHLVPPEFIHRHGGIRVASPGYAAVELASTDDGRAICECLRLKLASYDALRLALSAMGGSDGQTVRRTVVAACATSPWSYAELRLHRILLAAGITDWVANRPLRLGDAVIQPDIRFRGVRLVLEFDGRSAHTAAAQFLSDRERQNLLEAAGFRTLRFGWEHLDRPDYIVGTVRRALRAR